MRFRIFHALIPYKSHAIFEKVALFNKNKAANYGIHSKTNFSK